LRPVALDAADAPETVPNLEPERGDETVSVFAEPTEPFSRLVLSDFAGFGLLRVLPVSDQDDREAVGGVGLVAMSSASSSRQVG
jgi:hypothetical protein